MNKKVALYARVSTADQTSGLEAQMRTLKEFCERNNIASYEFLPMKTNPALRSAALVLIE